MILTCFSPRKRLGQSSGGGGGDGLNRLSLRPSGWGTSTSTTIMRMDGSQTPPSGPPYDSDRDYAGTNGLKMIFFDLGAWHLEAVTNPVTGGSTVLRGTLPAGNYGTLAQGSSVGIGNVFGFTAGGAKTKCHLSCVFRVVTNQSDGELPTGWVHPVSLKWFGIETSGYQVFVQMHEGGNYVRGEESTVGYFIPPDAAHSNVPFVKNTWYNFEVLIDLVTGTFAASVNGTSRFSTTHSFDEPDFTEMNIRVNFGGGSPGVVANDINFDFAEIRYEYVN